VLLDTRFDRANDLSFQKRISLQIYSNLFKKLSGFKNYKCFGQIGSRNGTQC